ncbi:hypothetical protein WG8_4830 [Paenibacillus sp. Aloe-11]|nr:hypothetical protein WG8_4830 [Paenibacillus sp. Aloe-11]
MNKQEARELLLTPDEDYELVRKQIWC